MSSDEHTGDEVTGDEVTDDEQLHTGDDVTGDDVTGDEVTSDDDDEDADDGTGDDVTIEGTGDEVTEEGTGDEATGDEVTDDEFGGSSSESDEEDEEEETRRGGGVEEKVEVSGPALHVRDLSARRFWFRAFGASYGEVSFEMLVHALEKRFPPARMQPLLRDRLLYDENTLFHMVRYVIDYAVNSDGVIDVHEFNKFVQRFGPFERCVVNCINALFSHRTTLIVEWFWGEYENNRLELEASCKDVDDDGRFVLMFAEGDAPHLELRVHDGQDWRVVPIHNDNGAFHLAPSPDLEDWQQSLRERTGSQDAVPSFGSLFDLIDTLLLSGRLTMGLESPLFKQSEKRAAKLSTMAGGLVNETCQAVVEVANVLRAKVREYFAAAHTTADRYAVFWFRLCDRLERMLDEHKQGIEKNIVMLDHQMFDLRCDIKSAIELWQRAIDGDVALREFSQEHGMFMQRDEFQRLEDAIYTSAVAVLQVVYKERELVLEILTRPPGPRHPWMEHARNLRVRRLFLFRMFGITQAGKVTRAALGNALALYLRIEFGQVQICAYVMRQLIEVLTEAEPWRYKKDLRSEYIHKRRWIDFMDRFGPLQHCYGKATAVCVITEPKSKTPIVKLAPWFRFWDRPYTERILGGHARIWKAHTKDPKKSPLRDFEHNPHTLFYVRPGWGNGHVFSMSFVHRTQGDPTQPGQTHTRILCREMERAKDASPDALPNRGFHFQENPLVFSDLHELLRMVVTRLKWTEQDKPLARMRFHWRSLNLRWSDIQSETNQPVHHLLALNGYFGGYVSELVQNTFIPEADFQRPQMTSGQEIRQLLTERTERNLAKFVAFCTDDKARPLGVRRTALFSYRNGLLVHELVQIAVNDEGWVKALEAVLDTFRHPNGMLADEGEQLFHKLHPITGLIPAEAIVEESAVVVRDQVPKWRTQFVESEYDDVVATRDAVALLKFFNQHDLLPAGDLFRVLSLSIRKLNIGVFKFALHKCASTSVLANKQKGMEAIISPEKGTQFGNNLFHVLSALDIQRCSVIERYAVFFCKRLRDFVKGYSVRDMHELRRKSTATPSPLASTPQRPSAMLRAVNDPARKSSSGSIGDNTWTRLIDDRNMAGQTPAMVAAERRRRGLLQFFLHECEASYDVLDENNHSLFNYILADLDNWLSDNPNEKLLKLFDAQRFTNTVNHRNRRNQSPLFIVLAKLKHLEDLDRNESGGGELKQMLSLKEDVEVLEKLMYKLLTAGALMDSLSGHQAKSDELKTYFLNKLVSAMADDREDKDRWIIFESAVRNRDTELVKGILDSKELPYFFRPPELSGGFEEYAGVLPEFATEKEDAIAQTAPLEAARTRQKSRMQEERRSLSTKDVGRVSSHQIVVGDADSDADTDGDDDDDDEAKRSETDEADTPASASEVDDHRSLILQRPASDTSAKPRPVPLATPPRVQSASAALRAHVSQRGSMIRTSPSHATAVNDPHDHTTEAIRPMKSILHTSVGLRDQDPELVELLLTHSPMTHQITETEARIREEGDKADKSARLRRKECLRPNVDAIDRRGRTALHVVAMLPDPSARSLEIARKLIAHIDVLAKDWRGYTALHYAAENGNLELVRLLLEAHAEPSEESTPGVEESSFARALSSLSDEEILWVSKSNDKMIKGRTPLHLAAKRGHWQVAAELLKDVKAVEGDADGEVESSAVDPIDERGRTPLCLALERRREMQMMLSRFMQKDPTTDELHRRSIDVTGAGDGQPFHVQIRPHRDSAPSSDEDKDDKVVRTISDSHLSYPSLDEHDDETRAMGGGGKAASSSVEDMIELGEMPTRPVHRPTRSRSQRSLHKLVVSRSKTSDSGLKSALKRTTTHESKSGKKVRVRGASNATVLGETVDAVSVSSPEEDANVRQQRKDNRYNIQVQLIMQMLQGVGTEVLESYTKRWKKSKRVSTDVCDYPEIEYKDVAKLERNFDNTVKKLLAKEASIETATSSVGYKLDDVIDVRWEWKSIRDRIESLEQKKLEEQMHDDRLARMYNQKKEDMFSERQNQIVIDWRYNRKLWNVLALRLFTYLVFVMLATALAVHETTRDELSAHFFHRSLEQTLIGDEFPHNVSQLLRTYEDIDDKSEFYMWMKGPFLEVFYPEPTYYWDGLNQTRRDVGYINKQARLIGVPRLRQLRSQNTGCDVPDEWEDVDPLCFTAVDEPDTATFGPDIAGIGPWEYHSQDELKGIQTWGRTGFFGGGGHTVTMPAPVDPGSREDALRKIEALEEHSFIDVKTRAVFVEFSAFDANQNHFAVCNVMLEFPRSGGTVVSSSFNLAPLRRYVDRHDKFVNGVLEAFIVLMVLFYYVNHSLGGVCRTCRTATEDSPAEEPAPELDQRRADDEIIYDLSSDRFETYTHHSEFGQRNVQKKVAEASNGCCGNQSACGRLCGACLSRLYVSLTEDGALVNWGLRLSLITLVSLRCYNLVESSDIDFEEQRAYVPVQRLGRFTVVESQMWSVFIFFAWFKLLSFLKVFRALSKLLIMIDFMLADLRDFAILLMLVLVAFASAEYVAYGYADPTAPTWVYSFIARFSHAFSGREIDGRNDLNRVLGVIYPMIFVIIVSLLLMNLLIAILTSAYDRARTRAGKSHWARWQYEKIRSEHDSPPFLGFSKVAAKTDSWIDTCKGPCRRAHARIQPRVDMYDEDIDLYAEHDAHTRHTGTGAPVVDDAAVKTAVLTVATPKSVRQARFHTMAW